MRYFSFLFLLFVHCSSPDFGPEVFVGEFTIDGNSLSINELINATENVGYDNQPSFSANGKFLLFSSTRSGQTDILQYHLESHSKIWLSDSEGSEYSPTLMPGDSTISSILLKPDGEQLLWSYPLESGEASVIVPEEVIGYHTWFDPNNLFTFVLADSTNPTSTLVHFDLLNEERTILAENIGRSLHRIPNSNSISYIQKSEENWTVNAYTMQTGKISVLTETLPEVEDMAWLTDSKIIMGKGSELWINDLNSDEGWVNVANLSSLGLKEISRIAVHSETNRIAIVSTL